MNDDEPGIHRSGRAPRFRYRTEQGRTVRDRATLERIRSLAIPPAWKDVWICARPLGHVQATGRDARGRKQHRYHPRFRAIREQNKYDHMAAFAEALPRIRRRCRDDLRTTKLSREKVLALVVTLLGETSIRVGNDEYARLNKSFGLSTLRDRHARVRSGSVEFQFRGKSGKPHLVRVCDRRLARAVKRCQDLPGELLFQYLDDTGETHSIESNHVNDYLREAGGGEFTAKDFRGWAGTLWAAQCLAECGAAASAVESKQNIKQAVASAAEKLGNTPSICRKCYIHPAILDAYEQGRALPPRRPKHVTRRGTGLSAEEKAVLRILKGRRKSPALPAKSVLVRARARGRTATAARRTSSR